MKKVLYIILLLTCTTLFAAGCTKSDSQKDGSTQEASPAPSGISPTGTGPITIGEDSEVSEATLEDLLYSMTLEEKVGQVFMVAFRYNNNGERLLSTDYDTLKKIQKYKPGGIVLFDQNINTISQTVRLIEFLQAASNIPLFIAIDEEGGQVSRLSNHKDIHSTKLPGNRMLGSINDESLTYKTGALLGKELFSLGINMNFAPVADVDTNPKNPVIGSRSFGSEPNHVGRMVQAMTKGLQDQGVCAVLKHFPGHGDTSTDTHKEAVVVQHDKKRLDNIELVPFKSGIKANADCIMAAHIQVPKVTGNSIPSTLSKEILTSLLREEMKFDGVIITDALEMGAISKYWSSDEAAILAFEAGADILLMPESLDKAFEGLLNAVKTGRISQERLNQSVKRILKLKLKRNLLAPDPILPDPEEVLGCDEHLKIAEEILRRAGK